MDMFAQFILLVFICCTCVPSYISAIPNDTGVHNTTSTVVYTTANPQSTILYTTSHQNTTLLNMTLVPNTTELNTTVNPNTTLTPNSPFPNSTVNPNATTAQHNSTILYTTALNTTTTAQPNTTVNPYSTISDTSETLDTTEGETVDNRGFDPKRSSTVWGIVIVTALILAFIGFIIYMVLKQKSQQGFTHRKLVEDAPSQPVLRLDNGEPLNLRMDGVAYYNPALQEDNIQMGNIQPDLN